MNYAHLISASLLTLWLSPFASAATPDFCGKIDDYRWVSEALASGGDKVEDAVVQQVKSTTAMGLCEITLNNGALIYANSLTRSLITGNLYSVTLDGHMINETAKSQAATTRDFISTIAGNDAITFSAKGERKGVIYVMTDTDCSYCRKLHDEVAALNAAGIEVNYLPFVRGGKTAAAYETMTGVWCATNRQEALASAFNGARMDKAECAAGAAVDRYQGAATKVRLKGTPHIIFQNGVTHSGYLATEDLVKMTQNPKGRTL